MKTYSRFIVLALLALGVLCDADAQKFRGIKPQMFGGAMSPLDAVAQASSSSQPSMARPALPNLLGRRLLVPQQYATIQTAIDSAVHGDTVLVAAGTYYENINFRGKAIVVASYMILNGDTTTRNNTIINGSQPIDPNKGSVVSFVSGEDTTSVIYGFTITGGTGTFSADSRVGGGVYCYASGPRIAHNRIINNAVAYSLYARGGGIGTFPFGNDSYSKIENNVIVSNSCIGWNAQGGGIYMPHGKIDSNVIRGNSCQGQDHALGGGIHAASDVAVARHLHITCNMIENNQVLSSVQAGYGGGIDIYGGIVVHIVDNTITNNHASDPISPWGGGMRLRYTATPSIMQGNIISNNSVSKPGVGGGIALADTRGIAIANNKFQGNSGSYGGGIGDNHSLGTLIQGNKFVGNFADTSGGGIYSEQSDLTIGRNLFEHNTAFYGGGVLCAVGNYAITNNIIVENEADWGGGLFSAQLPSQNFLTQIINNTIAGNVADIAGGIALLDAKTVLMNTISWGNSAPFAPEIQVQGGEFHTAYSDIRFGADSIVVTEGGTLNWLAGNITAGPAFLDTTMQLADSSPCIGAAVDSVQIDGVWLHAPPFCIYGMPRPTPAGTRPDIGACENLRGEPTDVPQWQFQTSLSGSPPLYSISTMSDRVAWVGSFDTVYRTTNGGVEWTPTPTRPTSTEGVACIIALSADTAFVGGGGPGMGGGNAKIYRTTNGGENWSIVYSAPGSMSYWNAIHFFDSQNAIALSDPPNPGSSFLIIKSTDAGVTWTPIANPPTPNPDEYGAQNMYFFDTLNGWFGTGYLVAPGAAGRVFRTTDGGNTWTPYPSGNTGWVSDVRFVSPLVGIRISFSSPFLTRSTDGGQTWTPVTNLPAVNPGLMWSATGAGGQQLWVSGLTQTSGQFILTSADEGMTWHEQTLPALPSGHVPRLSAVSVGDSVHAFGACMHLYISPNDGGEILSDREVLLTTGLEERTTLPTGYSLSQNYPNPFNPVTKIQFSIVNTQFTILAVYDLLGREVAVLVNEKKAPGTYQVEFEARNLASGVYFYRLNAGDFVAVKKMMLIR